MDASPHHQSQTIKSATSALQSAAARRSARRIPPPATPPTRTPEFKAAEQAIHLAEAAKTGKPRKRKST